MSNTESRGLHVSASSSKLVQDVVNSLNAEKVWPSDAVVYTNLEQQELLMDVARTHVVRALFAVNGLSDGYKIERRHNAEFMAPKNSKLPFLHVPNKVVAQEDILDYLYSRSFVLKNDLTAEENMVLQGVISLIETKLVPIEMYCVWIDPVNRKTALERYGYNYPQPLRKILCYKKQREVERYLKCVGVLGKSEDEIQQDLYKIYECIAKKLEGGCIIGKELTEADCYVFGHLQAILESKLENNMMTKVLENFPKLSTFTLNFNQIHLGNKSMIWEFI